MAGTVAGLLERASSRAEGHQLRCQLRLEQNSLSFLPTPCQGAIISCRAQHHCPVSPGWQGGFSQGERCPRGHGLSWTPIQH